MVNFFNYESPYRTGIFIKLNLVEKFLPIIIVFVMAILIFKFSDKFKNNKVLDKRVRIIVGIGFAIIYLSHYILRFALYGFDPIILPFQLCSISMFFAIILLFTKNKTIFNFVFYTGILGGLISLFIPTFGYNSGYYRYYQYEVAHGVLILIPIYFLAVYEYVPMKNETIKAFLTLQIISIFIVIFNYYAKTDFMFIFIDESKIEKFPIISKFGGIPLYLLWIEIVGIAAYFTEYQVVNFFCKSRKRRKKYSIK